MRTLLVLLLPALPCSIQEKWTSYFFLGTLSSCTVVYHFNGRWKNQLVFCPGLRCEKATCMPLVTRGDIIFLPNVTHTMSLEKEAQVGTGMTLCILLTTPKSRGEKFNRNIQTCGFLACHSSWSGINLKRISWTLVICFPGLPFISSADSKQHSPLNSPPQPPAPPICWHAQIFISFTTPSRLLHNNPTWKRSLGVCRSVSTHPPLLDKHKETRRAGGPQNSPTGRNI